ncbi:helix-turn-helix domain-containing protein [Streptomyces olivochromogenes]|uniref:helix-turn-helix domain-containing protein n=1 Tax=Streptomyces olivochromogenes TaxID=1963 RepID=UPI0036CA576E
MRDQRLERARRSLGDPRRRDFAMAAVAAQLGLTATTTFTRAFCRAYGVTPAEFRSTGRTA